MTCRTCSWASILLRSACRKQMLLGVAGMFERADGQTFLVHAVQEAVLTASVDADNRELAASSFARSTMPASLGSAHEQRDAPTEQGEATQPAAKDRGKSLHGDAPNDEGLAPATEREIIAAQGAESIG